MGSRIIQKLSGKSSFQSVEKVYKELKPHFEKMIKDRYGNYVFQKILELSHFERRNEMLNLISPNFVELSMTKTGTHTLQTLIEFLDENGMEIVVKIVERDLLSMSKNEYSTHLIQKILSIYPHYALVCILFNNFDELACNKHSIVVLKKLLNACSNVQYLRCQFLENFKQNFTKIVYD